MPRPPQTKYSSQNILNNSYDTDYDLLAFIPMVEDPTAGTVSPMSPANSLNLKPYDYVSMALSAGDTTETYTFKTGGSGGTTTNTVVIVYTDSTREVLSTVTKT